MKTHKICNSLVLIFVSISLISCNKWLDVRPSNQFSEEEQFETEQGYIDALTGIYQTMTSTQTYGKEMTFGFVDILAQLYNNANKATETNYYGMTARYRYTQTGAETQHNPRITVENIWQRQYTSIAHANYLLQHLDTKPNFMGANNYGIIKGEALALRAFLHFDLFRLFGPRYTEGTADSPAIPYMRTFTVSPGQVLSSAQLLQAVREDLIAAMELQAVYKDIDQIRGNQGSTSGELFLTYRQNRMNYWATVALLARVSLYLGEVEEARRYASEVIESGKFMFFTGPFNMNEKVVESDIIFTTEHIFSLYHSGLRDIADDYFKTLETTPEVSDLYEVKSVLDSYYETSKTNYDVDTRSTVATASRWNAHNATSVYTKKYYSDFQNNVKQRMIPLIRLPEMYYILAETSASISESLTHLNIVRQARRLPVLTATDVPDETTLQNEIFKEYRKEYYAEGQLWHFYKRYGYTLIPNGPGNLNATVSPENYVFPIPVKELEFNSNFE